MRRFEFRQPLGNILGQTINIVDSELIKSSKMINPSWVITKNGITYYEFRFVEVKSKGNINGGCKQYTIHRSITEDAHYIECKSYKTAFCKKYDLFQRRESIYATIESFENAIKRIEKSGVCNLKII
jgi:hypothetical protein